jgi:hypothetical protein
MPLEMILILGGREVEEKNKPKISKNPVIYIYSNSLGNNFLRP